MAWLCHLLDPAYLYSTGRPWPGLWAIGGMVLATLLGLALGMWRAARLRQEGRSPAVALAAMAVLLLGLAVFLAGARAPGPLSARIAYLAPSALGVALSLLTLGRGWAWSALLQPPLRVLACALQLQDTPWPWWLQIPWLALHGVGLYILVLYEGLSRAIPALALGCLLAAALAQGMAQRRLGAPPRPGMHLLRTEVLTPLLLPLLAYLGRWLGRHLCRIQVDEYVGYPWADPLSPWLDRQAMLYAGAAAMVLATATLCARAMRHAQGAAGLEAGRPSARLGQTLGAVLLLLGLGWYGAMAARHLSHGAAGSDPYCYLQMAIDLAERGTALHRFPLAAQAHGAGLPVWPLAPVGYHPPGPDGVSATVWPIGWPVLLAPWYRWGGEGAALWAAPAMVVLAALLALVCARAMHLPTSWLGGGLAAWLLLTSREVVWRSLVPLADGAAMALAALAILALIEAHHLALHNPGSERTTAHQGRSSPDARGAGRGSQQAEVPRGPGGRALWWIAVAGLALGMAYWVRHPLLPLVLAALPLLAERRRAPGRRVLHALVLAFAMMLPALVDLRYHATALGSPWVPESPESDLLSWRYMASGLGLWLDEGLLSRHELGYVLPLIVCGLGVQLRRPAERPQAMIMALGFAGVLIFGLSYRALRLRDLLALYPFLALWAGRGAAALWEWANRPEARWLTRRAALLLLLWATLGARSSWTLQRVQDPRLHTFGHLSAAQRQAYDQLALLLPADAVVACGLGAGAVAHYTGRETVRPASWSGDECQRFSALLAQDGRPLYAIQDGSEMADWLERTRAQGHTLAPVGTLNLPTFAAGGEPDRPGATLYRLAPSE